jgi:hypothetical protein
MGTLANPVTPCVETIYVEFGRDRTPLAWSQGRWLADDETAPREDIHRTLARIVADAAIDNRSAALRAVRSGEMLLVETRVGAASRADAAVVIVRPALVNWALAARQVVDVLAEGGVAADLDHLERMFADAWQQTRPVSASHRIALAVKRSAVLIWPFRRVIVGAAAIVALLWPLVGKRRRGQGMVGDHKKESDG